MPCRSCKSRHFGGTYHLPHQGENNYRARSSVSSDECLLEYYTVCPRRHWSLLPPWKYPKNGILQSHRCEILKSYIALTGWALQRRCTRYELSSYTPEDGILHSHPRETLKPYRIPNSVKILSLFPIYSLCFSTVSLLQFRRIHSPETPHQYFVPWPMQIKMPILSDTCEHTRKFYSNLTEIHKVRFR
jgi:hypothetical protein